MGRWTTGIITTAGALKIKISDLKKAGIFANIGKAIGTMNWESGAAISFIYSCSNGNRSIELNYTHTDYEGTKREIKEIIHIEALPSNLGIGENLFFRCPFSYRLCKILYLAYGSPYFKRRTAYQTRIYYMGQKRSKGDRYNYRYWDLDNQLEYLYTKGYKTSYRGRQTRIAHRVAMLEIKRNHYDNRRMMVLAAKFGFINSSNYD